MNYSYAEYVPAIKAIADETRLKIISMLSGGELCACQILEAFNITQPTLSYHMKILTDSGLVDGVREGSWMRYTMNQEKWKDLMRFMSSVCAKNNEFECKAACVCRGE